MLFRSPPQSNAHRSAILRGFAGAALCASAIAAVLLLAPVVGRWVGGSDGAPAPRVAGMPDDSGLALLGLDQGNTRRPHRERAKPAPRHRHAVLTAGDVVLVAGGEPAAQSSPAPPAPAPAPVTAKRPVPPKAPRSPAKKVTGGSSAITLPTTPAPGANAAASTGIVRLSVQSVGIAPNAAGEPELQAKLGIAGATPGDALPDTITLHLRPQLPPMTATTDTALALKAQVDMVDAPRSAPTDPALRLRVRMAIAAAPTGTPMVQEPGPADGKSNVIALTVALTSFTKVEDTPPSDPDPTTPPDQTPTDPTTPPDQQGPGDPTTPPTDPTTPPDQQGPGDPTTPPDQTPTDPTTPPDQTPADPTTPPDQTPTDPTTPPAAGAPAPIPPTEILIPVGPVRPNGGTATVPVTLSTGDTATAGDTVPIEVIVEELPPEEPPAAPGDVATPGVQDPAPEVVAPPTQPDPGTTPITDSGVADGSVAVVATDVASPDAPS